jgi:phenylacetate-CoA ligase
LPHFFARNIVIPIFDIYRGTKCMDYLNSLRESQWLTRDKIQLFQNESLRRLINYSYNNVPYYRQILDERGLKPADIETPADLAKLPILTKSMIREKPANLMAARFPAKKMFASSTSGSTGEPLKFYSTYDDFYNWGFAAAYRAYEWAGYDMGAGNIWFRGGFKYKSALRKCTADLLLSLEKTCVIDTMSLSSATISAALDIMRKLHPEILRGYSSAIALIAKQIAVGEMPPVQLKSIISTGEKLYDYQRVLFSEVFHCDTFDHYGSMELRAIATECPQHSGLHIAAENVIVEVVDNENRQLPAGSEGRILLTNLHNYAMPFIRYEIGDLGILSGATCTCGRELPLLAGLNGRTEDVIRTPEGKLINGSILIDRTAKMPGIIEFQIVQESPGNIAVKLVPAREFSGEKRSEMASTIISQYRNILGDGLEIKVYFIDRVEPTKEGKRRLVVSRTEQRS